MKLTKKLTLLAACCAINAVQIADATPTRTNSYKNQRGSVLDLSFHMLDENIGIVDGTFTTAVGNCDADKNKPLPISGYYNGNVISITVNFPHCKQVVAMTGYISADKSKLTTLWLDAMNATDPNGSDWNSNIIGNDSYVRMG